MTDGTEGLEVVSAGGIRYEGMRAYRGFNLKRLLAEAWRASVCEIPECADDDGRRVERPLVLARIS